MLESLAEGEYPPLDLVHLARQCFGDEDLKAELLALFKLQTPTLTTQLTGSARLSSESRVGIAHTLRGAALVVGAWRVASAAGRIEELASIETGQDSAQVEATAELLSAVAEVLAEIERIR
jgi:hypothetical protein